VCVCGRVCVWAHRIMWNRPGVYFFLLSVLFIRTLIYAFDLNVIFAVCLQCFDAVGWAAGRASGL